MPIELTAHSEAGARLVVIAEQLWPQLASRAAEHDRDGSYPFEAIDALKAAGYFAAPVPVELGGLGVTSAHDLVVASSRLARGDPSVAIGVNMHLVAVLNMERRRQVAVVSGAERRARGFAASLEQIARRGVVLAAAISERGQDLTRPGALATRTESGWRIDGRKMFCTMSPAATDLYVAVTFSGGEGAERYAYAMVPTDAPGVVVHDDWDALGMRASGSNCVSLDGVELPASGVRGGFRSATRCRTWSATWWPGCFTPRLRSASPSRPTSSPAARSSIGSTAMRVLACRGRQHHRPGCRTRRPLPRGRADRRTPWRQSGIGRHRRGARGAVRRSASRQGIRRRGGSPHRRSRARPLRRRRLRQRQPPRPRLPRRQGRLVHAPARRQPRLRLPRPRRARRTALTALRWRLPLQLPRWRRARARSAPRSADSPPASHSSPPCPMVSPRV